VSRKDPVTPEVYEAAMRRDGDCVAQAGHHMVVRLFGIHPWPAQDACAGRLEEHHVKDQPRMGKRAPSDVRHLVVVCSHHHKDGWATHRKALAFQREYLRLVNEWLDAEREHRRVDEGDG